MTHQDDAHPQPGVPPQTDADPAFGADGPAIVDVPTELPADAGSSRTDGTSTDTNDATASRQALVLRRALRWVIALNLSYAVIEIAASWFIGSVSLVADAADFLEDAAINILVLIALTLLSKDDGRRRAKWGRAMSLVILVPAAAAVVQAVRKALNPEPPLAVPMLLVAVGALTVNAVCAWILARHRHSGGSLSKVAWLAARNDVVINAAMIATAVLTGWLALTKSVYGWVPDMMLGVLILFINVGAVREVWEVARQEELAANVLAEHTP